MLIWVICGLSMVSRFKKVDTYVTDKAECGYEVL